MALAFGDRVAEFSTSLGIGDFTVTGAINAVHKPFSSVPVGSTFDGMIVVIDPTTGAEIGPWETGVYTVKSATVIERTTVSGSSAANNARISFGAGTKIVRLALTAFRAATLAGVATTPPPDPGTPPPPTTVLPTPTGILAGQTVTLTSGATYVGMLDIAGLSNVTIQTSGTAKARLTNGQAVSGWSLHSGNIWKAQCPFQPDQISVDRIPCHMAHFPSRATKANVSTGGTVNQLTYGWPNTDLVGCNLMIRTNNYSLSEFSITSMAGNGANFSPNINGAEAADANNKQFWVEGHKLHLLTENNSWAYVGGFVYLWATDGLDPSSKTVWASQAVDGVNAPNTTNCAIKNLEIIGCDRGVDGENAQSLDVLNCFILNSKGAGIYGGSNANGLIVDNCDINNSYHSAIDCYFGSNTNTIKNCRIANAGLVGNPRKGVGIFIGVLSRGNNIDNNNISNTSYTGIDVNANFDSFITRNVIDLPCNFLDDGGGIYTQSGANSAPLNTLIEGNTVTNGSTPASNGIYLDDDTAGVTVRGNTMKNNRGANLILHNARNNIIENNIFIADSDFVVKHIGLASNSTGRVAGNTIRGNTFTTRGTGSGPDGITNRTYNLESAPDLSSYASYTGNTYNHKNNATFARRWPGSGPGIDMTFQDWIAFSGETAAVYNQLP